MDIKPIKTDADYRAALEEIETLMMAAPDSSEGEKLDVLVTLVEAYEAKHYPLDLPDPVHELPLLLPLQTRDDPHVPRALRPERQRHASRDGRVGRRGDGVAFGKHQGLVDRPPFVGKTRVPLLAPLLGPDGLHGRVGVIVEGPVLRESLRQAGECRAVGLWEFPGRPRRICRRRCACPRTDAPSARSFPRAARVC